MGKHSFVQSHCMDVVELQVLVLNVQYVIHDEISYPQPLFEVVATRDSQLPHVAMFAATNIVEMEPHQQIIIFSPRLNCEDASLVMKVECPVIVAPFLRPPRV